MNINNLQPMATIAIMGSLEVLKNNTKLRNAIKTSPYSVYPIYKNDKKRIVYNPFDELKEIQQNIVSILQEHFLCPSYCFSWKGGNNIKNAKQHLGQNYYYTLDISHFYTNSKAKYVRKFVEEKLGLSGEYLDLFLDLTTYNGYLPTGAPTSPILGILIHQELFDTIYNAMEKQNITFTLYVDDMTLSSKKHISNSCIKYIKNVLKTHSLFLKGSKIKRFSYKGALVTGTYIKQSGQHQMRFKAGHKVVEMLQTKPIEEMSIKELRGLIAKIGYVNQLSPKQFLATKEKAIKQLKKLQKISERKEKNGTI